MNDNLREQLILLPDYFRGHLVLTVTAMAVGIAVSIPLGIVAAEFARVKRPVLTIVSIIQTFPSLAILALVVALLGGRIGFVPAFVALTLYSMLPIVRNTVTGLESVSDDVIEAATGIGMTSKQILLKVRLPLALPIIIAGVRTATVWTVGMATLSTLVGATSFGNYIFTGIQTRNLIAVTVGSIASAIMAVVLDSVIGGVEWLTKNHIAGTTTRNVRLARLAVGTMTATILVLTAFAFIPKPKPDFVIGAKGFTEQYIIAGLLAATLEQAGYRAEQRLGLGTDIVYEATRHGTVDLYLEYTGTVWANHLEREDNPGRVAVRDAVIRYIDLQDGMSSIGTAGFQNLYALAMRRDRAEELGVKTIEDLIPIADKLACGADLEFFGRPEWYRVRDTYNMDFGEKLTFDTALMYTAVHERQVDLITAYTTDGRVAAYDLVIIEDPRDALLPYDGLYVASSRAAAIPGFIEALSPLIGAISDEAMRKANKMVDVDGKPITEAVDFLRDHSSGN